MVWRMRARTLAAPRIVSHLKAKESRDQLTASQLHPTYPLTRRSPPPTAVATLDQPPGYHTSIESTRQYLPTMDYDAEGGAINVRFLQVHRPFCPNR
jgi:hypothetical protein